MLRLETSRKHVGLLDGHTDLVKVLSEHMNKTRPLKTKAAFVNSQTYQVALPTRLYNSWD